MSNPIKSAPEQLLEALAQQRLDHLVAQDVVVVPWLFAGYYDRDSPEASPEVERVTTTDPWPQHPLNSKPMMLAQLTNIARDLWASYDRIACTTTSCSPCSRVWEKYRSAVEDVPPDESISALLVTEDSSPPLIVDAWDIPTVWEDGEEEPCNTRLNANDCISNAAKHHDCDC